MLVTVLGVVYLPRISIAAGDDMTAKYTVCHDNYIPILYYLWLYIYTCLVHVFCLVPSGPPQDVVAVATSSRTVHVTWNDVLAAERNGVLTEYEVHV